MMKLADRRPSLRTGSSVYQMITCFVAAGAGAWLGAQYMGVKIEDIAYTALDQTEMLEKLPEDWRPELSDCPTGNCEPETPPEVVAAELQDELSALRLEANQLREAVASGGDLSLLTRGDAAGDIDREETIGYWTRLGEIAAQVTELDQNVESAVSGTTTGHVFDLRRRAFEYGQRAIEAVPTERIDPLAVEAGHRLGEWYREGAAFYAEATKVWDGLAGADQASGAEAALEKDRRHQVKQTKLLRAKLAELNSVLTRRYAVAFPAIGI